MTIFLLQRYMYLYSTGSHFHERIANNADVLLGQHCSKYLLAKDSRSHVHIVDNPSDHLEQQNYRLLDPTYTRSCAEIACTQYGHIALLSRIDDLIEEHHFCVRTVSNQHVHKPPLCITHYTTAHIRADVHRTAY